MASLFKVLFAVLTVAVVLSIVALSSSNVGGQQLGAPQRQHQHHDDGQSTMRMMSYKLNKKSIGREFKNSGSATDGEAAANGGEPKRAAKDDDHNIGETKGESKGKDYNLSNNDDASGTSAGSGVGSTVASGPPTPAPPPRIYSRRWARAVKREQARLAKLAAKKNRTKATTLEPESSE